MDSWIVSTVPIIHHLDKTLVNTNILDLIICDTETQIPRRRPQWCDECHKLPLYWSLFRRPNTVVSTPTYTLTIPTRDISGMYEFINDTITNGVLVCDWVGTPLYQLTDTAMRLLRSPNAGGNSVLSEAIVCDIFERVFTATRIRGELDITYMYDGYAPCDLMVDIGSTNTCISVTRAMDYRDPSLYQYHHARDLLIRKMSMMTSARDAVVKVTDEFIPGVLCVWCQTSRIADIVINVYDEVKNSSSHIFLVCIVAPGNPEIFTNWWGNR